MKEKLRKTGIDIIDNAPWGRHFCLFYQAKEDLGNILVPYFKTGLENNEFCMWVTSEPLGEEEAKQAMRKAMPDFDRYLEGGQIEIIPHTEWYLKDGAFDLQTALNGWIDKLNQALANGYDGIRVTGNTAWLEKGDWPNFTDYEEAVNNVIGEYRMLAICTYALDRCGASEVVDVVSNHQFALIRREGEWVCIESSERKQAVETLRESEQKYRSLFENMLNGFAYCQILVDENNQPIDFVYLEVNDAFEKLTGLKREDVVGKRVTEAIPDIKESHPELFSIYGKVALTGEETNFDVYFEPLAIWLTIFVYSPRRGYFVAVFENITERKQAGEEISKLARFPSENPAPVLRVAGDGTILYANQAALPLLNVWGCQVGQLLPEYWCEFVLDVLSSGLSRKDVEVECQDRIFSLTFAPIARANYLNLYGLDITERKQAEEAINQRLEFEKITSAISSRFVGASDIDVAINASLA